MTVDVGDLWRFPLRRGARCTAALFRSIDGVLAIGRQAPAVEPERFREAVNSFGRAAAPATVMASSAEVR